MRQLSAALGAAALLTAGVVPAMAQAAMARVAIAASAASGKTQASARQVAQEAGRDTASSPVEAAAPHDTPAGWQRWGERLLALGVGAAVGWVLLRLGRDGGSSPSSASEPK